MISSLTSLATTTTGKILLGSMAAATAFGGASAAGFVDVASADVASADLATDTTADVAVAADGANRTNGAADTNVQNQFRVNASNAGSFGVAVGDGELRLSDISSSAGWSGQLIAASGTGMTISFANDIDLDRTVSAQLALVIGADSANVADAFVLATVTNEDGMTTTTRFSTSGSVASDDVFAAALDAATDKATDASATIDGTITTTTAAVQAATDAARATANDTVDTAVETVETVTATVEETVTTTSAAVQATASAAVTAGTATVQATTDAAITAGSNTITTTTGAVQATTDRALETVTGANIEADANAAVQAAPVVVAAAIDTVAGANNGGVDLNSGGTLGLGIGDADANANAGLGLGLGF